VRGHLAPQIVGVGRLGDDVEPGIGQRRLSPSRRST
jgi:hypothetical protein